MTTSEFLTHLRSLGAELRVDGNRLNCTIPKALLTPDLSTELKERKTEILAFLQRADATLRSREPRLQPIPRDGALPLSFAQQRLWFLEQLEPGSPLYNIPYRLRVIGRLNIESLERSLNEIVRRHESLRTAFSVMDGQPVQVIAPVVRVTVPVHDLSSVPEREVETLRQASDEAWCPFDLARAPLLRAKVLRLAEDEHILLLTLHHIVSDAWSMGVLLGELSAIYNALVAGKPSPLSELPIQYVDFAVWQRQWLTEETLNKQLEYWKRNLTNLSVLELTTDRFRPAVQSHDGGTQCLTLSESVSHALKVLSRAEGATLFMTLLAAFEILLYRYSGQHDIVVGTPIANRNRAEIEPLIGLFVNTLVLRTDLSNNPPFRELLARVREVCLGAYAHQDVPFEKLVEELHPDRNLSVSPLFQVWFVFHNTQNNTLQLSGLTISPVRVDKETAKFDLALVMWEDGQRLCGSLQYREDLFDEPTIIRMANCLQTLFEDVATNPDKRIGDLLLWSSAETEELVCDFNQD
jgi:Condensation domain/TubC N-terminal docking domain